jgi:S-adenosylmethionine:tRNA ribosyltransferase-isomerase
LKTSDFDYELPPELIAQEPIEPRDASRLLVLDRSKQSRQHRVFRDLLQYLNPDDLLVVNRSRVVPARLFAKKLPGDGKVELLLLERLDGGQWKTLVGGKGLTIGTKIKLENGMLGEITRDLGGPQRLVVFDRNLDASLSSLGQVPLPPYIHTSLADPERYQTVYAKESGSSAAPTAGLHFTPELLDHLSRNGIPVAEITLHIGLDTFAPVNEDDPGEHKIHTEWCQLSEETAGQVNATKRNGGKVVAVGTTSVRVLETAARLASGGNTVFPFEGRTELYILPGFEFNVVDRLLTNFHLPRSTLLMLVSAFAGRDLILDTYCEAIAEKYRFYSFGDAMLIL